jgi:undecaprenyl-diphosphatase
MFLLVVFFLVGTTAALIAALVWSVANRDRGHVTHGAVHATARAVQRELATHQRVRSFVRDRISPASVTGLALTAALAMLVGVAVLGFEVRRQSFVARADLEVARWAAANATATSTALLRRVTDLGGTSVVLTITTIVAVLEVLRTRARGVIVFLAVVVVGAGLANGVVKTIVGRPRPTVAPLASFSGMSFPSGHSASAAACFAACALCLGRKRSLRARLVITVVSATLAVMVATSRVLLGVHWASDAFAGLCFGAAWFALCAIAFGGRLLRFGAPIEAATRVDGASSLDIANRGQGEVAAHDDAHGAERSTHGDVREEVHPEHHS